MKAEVKLFALARQLAGRETLVVDLPVAARVADLRQTIERQHPELAELVRHAMFAVNTEYADESAPIPDAAEIACIPPVSGG